MPIEWECIECGYIYEGTHAPARCPECLAVGAWEKVKYVGDRDDYGDDDDVD